MGYKTNPNILLLVIDTCRARTFDTLLHEGVLSGMEQLVQEGTHFTNAMSSAPWTVPSHGSLFTGLYPTDHGSSADDPYFTPPIEPLAQRLKKAGYTTTGLSANPWISPSFDYDAGFERFKTADDWFWGGDDLSEIKMLSSRREQFAQLVELLSIHTGVKTIGNLLYSRYLSKKHDTGAKHLTDAVIDWIEEVVTNDSPFFGFINYMEPHLEYDPPNEYLRKELPIETQRRAVSEVNQDQWAYVTGNNQISDEEFDLLERLYRAEIRYLDSQVERIISHLESVGVLDETAIILVGDHGENIGDHGLMDHQFSLYQTLLHVPLVIRYPEAFDPGTDNRLVETRQVFETLCELGETERVARYDTGESLLAPSAEVDYAIAEYTEPQPSIATLEEQYGTLPEEVWTYDRALRAIQDGSWKLVEHSDGSSRLFNLDADPDEVSPVNDADRQEALHDELIDRRGTLSGPQHEQADIDDASKARLEDLGYL